MGGDKDTRALISDESTSTGNNISLRYSHVKIKRRKNVQVIYIMTAAYTYLVSLYCDFSVCITRRDNSNVIASI